MTGWDIIFKLLEASPASATMFGAALILFGIYIASSWMKIRSFEKKLGMNGTVGPDTVLVKGDLWTGSYNSFTHTAGNVDPLSYPLADRSCNDTTCWTYKVTVTIGQ